MHDWLTDWLTESRAAKLSCCQLFCRSVYICVCLVCHICMINKFIFAIILRTSKGSFLRFSACHYLGSESLVVAVVVDQQKCCCFAFNAALEITLIVGDAIYENYCTMMRTRTKTGHGHEPTLSWTTPHITTHHTTPQRTEPGQS